MAMASSGGRPRSSLSERQMVGLFSLVLGVMLFLLILMRGQQAAREGNQEISNDTYWVLVSPLVFSAFGVVLLRSPKAGVGARGRASVQPVVMRPQVSRALEQSQRTTQSAQAALASVDEGASQQLAQARAEAAAALAALESLHGEHDRTAAQAAAKIRALQAELSAAQQARVQLEANLRRDLVTQTADTSGALAAVQLVEGQLDAFAGGFNDQMAAARRQLDGLIASQEQQLAQLRSEASKAQAALDRLRGEQESQLARLRSEASRAISAAQAAQADTQAVAADVSSQMATMDQQIQQAQQSCSRATASLDAAVTSTGQGRAEALATAQQAQRQVEKLAGTLAAQMDTARQQLAAAVQASKQAQEVVDRLEHGAHAFVAATPTASSGSDAFLSCYRQACEELGVLPGSGWQDVRATWRRNVMDWHPDQGGDSRLWVRRNAAYQLLVAWYEFKGAS